MKYVRILYFIHLSILLLNPAVPNLGYAVENLLGYAKIILVMAENTKIKKLKLKGNFLKKKN